MQGRTISFANVASGDTCSSAFAVGRRSDSTTFLFLPPITSAGTVQIQGAIVPVANVVSADFATMQNPYGSGPATFIPGAGRVAIPLHDILGGIPSARVVFGVAQANPSSLAIVTVF